MSFSGDFRVAVTSASGIEAVTKRELVRLGIPDAPAENGLIVFDGSLKDAARSNLFLRTADRVYLVLREFEARDFNALFDGVSEVVWEDMFPRDAKINVQAKSENSALFALSTIQSIVKKAICVRLMKKYRVMSLTEDGVPMRVKITVLNDKVTILLDTSGEPLHKRGYRDLVGEAPLKETLAAALILLSVWNPDRALIDPFCGSGTIPVEAARIGLNIASGRDRAFAFEEWAFFPKDITKEARQECLDTQTLEKKLRISGFDIDENAVGLARRHAERAGVADAVHLQTCDMREVKSRYRYGVAVTNPPYGERLLNEREALNLYKDFGKWFRSLQDWSLYAITSLDGFERAFGAKADKNRKLYNGKLKCRLYQYLGKKPETKIDASEDGQDGQ